MRVAITGANRGIGLEFARQCLDRGDEVWAGVRAPERAVELEHLAGPSGSPPHVVALDVNQPASVRAFARALGDAALHLLINNAGVTGLRLNALALAEADDVLHTLAVNAVGPLRVTQALLPALRVGKAKVIHVSSALGSISDNRDGGSYGYRMSKAALNMLARTMAAELRREQIVTALLSPGWVQTGMGGPDAPTPVDASVRGMLRVIDSLTLAKSGGFFDTRGDRLRF